MISPQLKIQITSYFENIRKLRQKPDKKHKIALFLNKTSSFIHEISKYNQDETNFFFFEWKILNKFSQADEILVKIKLIVRSKRSNKTFDLEFVIFERNLEFVMIVSDFNSEKQDKVHKFMNLFYPVVSSFYLIHQELLDIISYLESKFKYELFSKWYIMSEKLGKRPDKDIKYLKGKYYKDCFQKARNEKKFVENIRLDNLDTFANFNNGKPYDFKLSRIGEITIYQGKFDNFYLSIIEMIIKYANEKFLLLKDRSRIMNVNKEIKPIVIQFFFTPFKDKKGIATLLNTLKSYNNCSYAIIHAGNPYLEMIFVDYSDNSSFSLVTFSNKSLVIYPQLYASEAALIRLFSFITKNFSDGDLYDYEDYKKLIEI